MGNEHHDLIWGTASIAREVGLSEPKAKKLLTAGRLPARQIEGRWCASRTQLRKALIGSTGAAVAAE